MSNLVSYYHIMLSFLITALYCGNRHKNKIKMEYFNTVPLSVQVCYHLYPVTAIQCREKPDVLK